MTTQGHRINFVLKLQILFSSGIITAIISPGSRIPLTVQLHPQNIWGWGTL